MDNQDTAQVQPIILAGGFGSRLWPLSRELYPKQLFKLTGGKTLLQETCCRIKGVPGACGPIVVVGKEHRFMVKEQLAELALDTTARLIVEPVGRNTAPACLVAALEASSKGNDPLLLVTPADHLVQKANKFIQATSKGLLLAAQGALVTFGIHPDRAETAYGYIEAGDGNTVIQFVEKPDLATAEQYIAKGNFYWNSGIFLFRASRLLEEAEHLVPEMLGACKEALEKSRYEENGLVYLDKESFSKCPSDSIDYAILEHIDGLSMVPVDMGWSDVGSWQALHKILPKDGSNNVIQGDVIAIDTSGSLVWGRDRLVATLGIKDMLVVETADAVLVVPLKYSQEIRQIVDHLKSAKREEYLVHKTAYRPWGSYTVLEEAPRFKIKRISVKPGAKLSLQMHYHRSEHWVVVKGTASVTRDDDVFLLRESESTFISPGQRHRLENPGRIPLEIIEIQNGSYLGEDDIVRFEDQYGRDQGQ
ncbi:MAG: mannose-1-phosphate guanylyltransferase/mannose-6-phosphate isomerase [Nitrospiraceae bacterium]|nr:mannose-1-phosphate guanylyltransferase/mannose-6-phosphate isomerase [Nitrospiraceae bacterium]